MPRRSLSQRSFFDPEVVMPDCLESGTVPWLLARYRGALFPNWLFKGWRGEGRRGRNAWPAQVLVSLLLLRWSEEGMSRLGSTKRAKVDVSWRAAMGLHLQTQIPDEKTLREFESFLRGRHPQNGQPRHLVLHEHIVRWCLDSGVMSKEATWTFDSTPMWCYGAVLDTVRLLGEGTLALARRWAKATSTSLEQVAELWQTPYILQKSIKGHFRIDWSDVEQRTTVIETVAQGAVSAVAYVRCNLLKGRATRRKRLLRRCAALLRVIEQDFETDAQGRLVIARRVAKDRIISLTDPCARHGRKTNSKTFNGFKLHVLGDIVSGLIASVTVTAGNAHDGSAAHRLIRRAKALVDDVETVLGDTAYGGATLRHRVKSDLAVHIVAPAPANTRLRKGHLGRASIAIDFDTMEATCAQGIKADVHRRVWSKDHQCLVSSFRWPNDACRQCPVRQSCNGERRTGHIVRLHPHEKELRQAREDWQQPQVRELYRKRGQCERLVNQLTRHGARRARGWGQGSAHLQAHLIAIRCNLQLLARALAEQRQQIQLPMTA